ncbi:HAD-IC family P-type ATPase [Moritella sp. Urea-trap-13]|uniref:cation-translocating P-type ATPase n=1 Tax=Moritella sp. Urea-trap-13 TaxID=2058327 RepID=UPI000C3363AE|nr:HAD-IC family P-type ATPase [Moritella sp. Urea-trap-13]PKH06184.1 haloacid dehalogenase [Moritella sp. Urea-trap-13]
MTQSYPPNLTGEQAEKNLTKFGPNILPESKPPNIGIVFLRQFKSPFIYVLLVAAVLSFFLGQKINAFFILVVLFINAVIGTFQEYSAERAASALKKMVPSYATVIRNNKPIKIHSQDVVLDDLVQLVPGDKVPADILLCTNNGLQIDESMLTGESVAAYKSVKQPLGRGIENGLAKADSITGQNQCCFAGTVVMRGRGSGHVTATGINTEIGKITTDVEGQQTKPPLLQRIEAFTLRITYGILILITFIFIITLLRGDELGSVFLLAVALAVSAIPEGLPAAITVALAIGMLRMAKRQVIIRNLLAVEALGSCTYIASDKTGTLTVNEMTIQHIWLADGCQYQVSGEGVDVQGEIRAINGQDNNRPVELLTLAGLLANEAYLEKTESGWSGQGDMVDVAFLVLAAKYGIDYKEAQALYPELAQIPYESERAYCASINRYQGKSCIFVKGSVETLLEMCGNDDTKPAIAQQANTLASKGYRVLGLAYGYIDEDVNGITVKPEDALHDLNFAGMVGMIDPLRPDVKNAVEKCKAARINVAMITGDHPITALALAVQAGIADKSMSAITGLQLNAAYELGPDKFSECVHSTNVFARVSPHQKKQIIEQIMNDGDFVAVTGDGVNDAPALKHAHVGIAMGLRGTDVARESADIILTDDHFTSIVQGILQGRIVYNNIRKVIYLLISTGAAEILLVMFSLLFGTPLPLLPLQLLWLNLVTNGIQDKALAFEPEEGSELDQPARSPNEAIFNHRMIERVVVTAIVMGSLAFVLFKWQIDQGVSEFDARNVTLLLMVLFENVHVLNSRSERLSIFKQYFFGNKLLLFGMLAAQGVHIAAMYTPGLQTLLQIKPVSFAQWSSLLGIALLLIGVDELHKWIDSRRNKPGLSENEKN